MAHIEEKEGAGRLPKIVVGAALIREKGRYMVAQRPEGVMFPLMWEFPGGKARAGEPLEDCIKRELDEELGLIISNLRAFTVVNHSYDDFEVELNLFFCRAHNLDEMVLNEHNDLAWLHPEDMDPHSFLPADRPVIMRLRELKTQDDDPDPQGA